MYFSAVVVNLTVATAAIESSYVQWMIMAQINVELKTQFSVHIVLAFNVSKLSYDLQNAIQRFHNIHHGNLPYVSIRA